MDRPEPVRRLEHGNEPLYTEPDDRWEPVNHVYSTQGYHREFVEPYSMPGEGRLLDAGALRWPRC